MRLIELCDTPSWMWPKETADHILPLLRGDAQDEDEKLLATEMAGDVVVIDDELADALLGLVRNGDESDELRSRAAISLGPALQLFDDDRRATIHVAPEYQDSPIGQAMGRRVQREFHRLYMDADVPTLVRRRILEVSVRAPEDWHPGAVRAGLVSSDRDWRVTAVFCMAYIPGFNDEIVETLENDDLELRYLAIIAADMRAIRKAWPSVLGLVRPPTPERPMLLAAISALASIRPQEAKEILVDLLSLDDPEIHDAVMDALAMAGELDNLDPDETPEPYAELPTTRPVEQPDRAQPLTGFGSIDEIIAGLCTHDGGYKREAVDAALQRQDEVTPALLRILGLLIEAPETYLADKNFYGHIYAVLLLRQFRETGAHPLLMKLARLPDDLLTPLFGDLVTQEFGGIFYATCGGDLGALQDLARDRDADQFIRAEAMHALVLAVADGMASREKMVEFLAGLLGIDEARPGSGFWSFAASSLLDLYPAEAMDAIEEAFARGLIDEFHVSLAEFQQVLDDGWSATKRHLDQELQRGLPGDLHAHMADWACFRDQETRDNIPGERPVRSSPNREARQKKKKRRKQAKKSRKKGRGKKKRKR